MNEQDNSASQWLGPGSFITDDEYELLDPNQKQNINNSFNKIFKTEKSIL
jgi:hypothetical protein